MIFTVILSIVVLITIIVLTFTLKGILLSTQQIVWANVIGLVFGGTLSAIYLLT